MDNDAKNIIYSCYVLLIAALFATLTAKLIFMLTEKYGINAGIEITIQDDDQSLKLRNVEDGTTYILTRDDGVLKVSK